MKTTSRWIPSSKWAPAETTSGAANAALIGLAVFAFAWAVARAHVQAVTGDEGVTYTFFAERNDPSHWLGEANNHILNSIILRVVTSVFGLSHLSVRAGALAGAAIYIAAAYCLTRLASAKWVVQIPLFICLVYNPFVFDFYVAARGYGMAAGFLIAAIAFPAWCYLYPDERNARRAFRACALASIFLALSFTANFSFAFVLAVILSGVVAWAFWLGAPNGTPGRWKLRFKLLAACGLPGLAVLALFSLYTVLHFPKGELYDGGTSVSETVRTVVEASLFRVNRYVLNPFLYNLFDEAKDYLLRALLLAVLLHALVILRNWPKLRNEAAGRRVRLAVVLVGIVGFTLFLHHKTFLFFGVLMPRHRTAIWIVPLCTLAAGLVASIRLPSRVARVSRGMLIGVLFVIASYYLACLRLTYFKEWQYQEDVKKVYDVIAWYNHNRCVQDVEVSWRFHGALTFYRSMSGRESLNDITVHMEHPAGKQLYVLDSAFEGEFIEKQGLKVVYHGKHTDAVVAVQPEYLDPPKAPCSALPTP